MKKKNEKFFKNEIYLKRNRYQNPKENFKKLINILIENFYVLKHKQFFMTKN